MRQYNPFVDAETRPEAGLAFVGLEPTTRSYQSWVADETIEDYALRYAPRSYRRWTPGTIVHTALVASRFLRLKRSGRC